MRVLEISWSERAAQAVLRGLWFFAIPLGLTGVALRYLSPTWPSASGRLLSVLRALSEQPALVAVGLFVVFAALVRYWRFHLPGGRYLARVPLRFAAAERSQLVALEQGFGLRSWLRAPRTRRSVARLLDAPARRSVAEQSKALGRALRHADIEQSERQRAALSATLAPVLRARAVEQLAAFVALVALGTLAALYSRAQWFQNYRVLSSSMLPTFERGDHLIASRSAYPPTKDGSPALPRRGEIVIFRRDSGDELVKRVIGLPGDLIEMDGGVPIINGWRAPGCDVGRFPYLREGLEVDGRARIEFIADQVFLTVLTPQAIEFTSYRVKPGEVFVLGDNRNQSLDSRTWSGGLPAGLPLRSVQGRVTRLLYSSLRTGAMDLASIFQIPGIQINLDGLDTRQLERRIALCVKDRPSNTEPPAPSADSRTSLR